MAGFGEVGTVLFGIAALVALGMFLWGLSRDSRRLGNAVWLGTTLLCVGLWGAGGLVAPGGGTAAVVRSVVLVVIVLVPLGLVANGVVMVRREGNRLSLAVGLVSLGVLAFCWFAATSGHPVAHAVAGALVLAATYLGFLFASVLLYSALYGGTGRRRGFDAVVVLGARLIEGRVTPLLAARLDRGLVVFRREVGALLVVSGGKGSDETVAEAVAMREYLVGKGVPSGSIVVEDRSTNTEENLRFSAALLRERGRVGRIAVVTNNFHVFRAAVLSRRLRLRARVIGAETALYYLPSALLREFVALLARDPLRHVAACACLIGLYLVGAA